MTQREKRLLAVLGLVAVVCGADWLWTQTHKAQGPSSAESQLTAARKSAGDMAAAVAALPLKQGELYALALSQEEISSTPFRAPLPVTPETGTAAGKADSAAGAMPALQFTGFVSVGNTAMAIISGMEYAVGDTVPQTGDVVHAITESSVVLYSPSRGAEWELSYTGDDF